MLVFLGRWKEALYVNGTVFLWMFFIVYALVSRYFVQGSDRWIYFFLIFTCIITIVYYVIRMVYIYPFDDVLLYYEDNLMNKLLAS